MRVNMDNKKQERITEIVSQNWNITRSAARLEFSKVPGIFKGGGDVLLQNSQLHTPGAAVLHS